MFCSFADLCGEKVTRLIDYDCRTLSASFPVARVHSPSRSALCARSHHSPLALITSLQAFALLASRPWESMWRRQEFCDIHRQPNLQIFRINAFFSSLNLNRETTRDFWLAKYEPRTREGSTKSRFSAILESGVACSAGVFGAGESCLFMFVLL